MCSQVALLSPESPHGPEPLASSGQFLLPWPVHLQTVHRWTKIHLSPYEHPAGALLNSLQIPPCFRPLLPPDLCCNGGCLGLARVTGDNPASLADDIPSGRGSNGSSMNPPPGVHNSCLGSHFSTLRGPLHMSPCKLSSHNETMQAHLNNITSSPCADGLSLVWLVLAFSVTSQQCTV